MDTDRVKEEFVVDSIRFNRNGDFYDIIINGYPFSISSHRVSYGVDACCLFIVNQIDSLGYPITPKNKSIDMDEEASYEKISD